MSSSKQAQIHLLSLGYGPTDRVYFRAIGPNGAKKIEGTIEQRFDELRTLNGEGSGVYLVVNGGGQSDADVTHGRAIFFEHDDIPKEAQIGLWQTLGLPEPTFQIDTRGKSIHSYWAFDQPIPIATWKILQKDLLDFADADRSIKNPSRVMRLAGFNHQKSGGQSVIISNSGKHYSFDELRSVVTVPEPAPNIPAKPATQPRSEASSSDIGAILSDDILPRLSAAQIFNWSGHGFQEQPDGKLKGHCPWHDSQSGTSFWVTPSQDGGTFSGACPSCTGNKKLNAVAYRYALKTNKPGAGQPTGRDFFDVAKELAEDAGVQLPEYDPRQTNGDRTVASADGDSKPFTVLNGGKTSPKVSRTLKSDILAAMDEGLSGSDLEARKIQVASANGIPAQTLGILWRQIEKEIEQQEGRSAQSDEIERLLSKKAQRLDISQILPESLAGPLKRRAELLGSTPEILLTTLLPVIASQAKIGTKLHLSRGSEWEALPIFWSGIVGEPATAKSPSLNVFFKPLRAIQGLAIDRYKEELKYFEKLEEKGEDVPEKALRYLVDDVTIESLARIQDEQPDHGCLIGVDELAGFVNSLGQYKGGKGSDKQKVLGIRDGKGFSVSRAGKDDIMTSSSSFSLCGAIQPGILAQQMGDFTDTDGYWSRFCWCLLPLLRKQLETPEKDAAIAHKLRHDIEFILATVKSFHPLGYELSPDAKASCEAFREEMEDRRMDHPNNTMKIVHGKVQGQVGEVALILHLLWGTYGRGSIPDIFVSETTMQRAIEVMRFFIVQAELIQALGEEVQGGESSIYTKMIELSHKKGWVKASDASKSVRAIKDDKQKDGNYVRVLFLELEAMGKGELKGKGRSLEFKAFTGAKVSIDESPLSYPGWTLADIQDVRETLKADPDSSEALRAIVPPELWPQVGIAA